MTMEHLASSTRSLANTICESPERPLAASYERELAIQEIRLRETLNREATLRRQNDELIERQQVLRKPVAHREDAADRVARLTPRQRRASIMKKTGSKSLPALTRVALAAAWNGVGEPFLQPLSKLALAAAWNGAADRMQPAGNSRGVTAMPADLNPDLHRDVRNAYRQAMAQHRTNREAFRCATDLLLNQEPDADPARAGRLVAVMLANEP